MSQGQIKISGEYDLVFEGKAQQDVALFVLCKKTSLANIIEKAFGVTFPSQLKNDQYRKATINNVRVYGKPGSEEKVKKTFEILASFVDSAASPAEKVHFSKELIEDITAQLNEKGSYSRRAFNQTASNQNSKGTKPGGPYTFSPRTNAQRDLWQVLSNNTLTFGVGPAGTGKTHVAVAKACKMLEEKQISRIVLTRPAVTSGKDPGALPGDLDDKLAPYMMPLYDELERVLGKEKLRALRAKGDIVIAPVEMMRGRTFINSFVIVDEAQNCTKEQIKMALTRIGDDTKMAVTGDPMQIDLKDKSDSGLKWAYERLNGENDIGIQFFGPEDVVRHEVVKTIVRALDDNNEATPGANIKQDSKRQAAPRARAPKV